jgi:hypothetical protein
MPSSSRSCECEPISAWRSNSACRVQAARDLSCNSDAPGGDYIKVNAESARTRVSFECTIERVTGGWRAHASLRDPIGLIVERRVRDAPTKREAIMAATDALSAHWTW